MIISIDTETHLIKPGMQAPALVCLTEASEALPEGAIYNARDGVRRFWQIIRGSDIIVGHFVFYDLAVLCAEDWRLIEPVFQALDDERIRCTQIRMMMIDNAEGDLKFVEDDEGNLRAQDFSLKRLAARLLGHSMKKGVDTWRLRYRELDDMPVASWPADARQYALGDAVETLAVYHALDTHRARQLIVGEADEVRAAWALYLMQCWGVSTDGRAVEALREALTTQFNEWIKIAAGWKFVRPDGTRDIAAIRAQIERECVLRGVAPKTTAKGAISTTREVLEECEHEGLSAVSEVGRVGKLLNTYVPMLARGAKVPINPTYNSIIETYRTSCRRPNLQNPPRAGGVRECFVSRPGYVFAFCDYDTLEMRTLAQVCLDLFDQSDIADALHAGQDLHLLVACDILAITYEDGLRRYQSGDAEVKTTRSLSKISNYGLGGGMGPRAFISYAKGYGIVIDIEMSEKLHRQFREKWCEMDRYFAYCSNEIKTHVQRPPPDYDVDSYAKRIKFIRTGMLRGKVRYTAVCNGYFQHLAAVGGKVALYRVAKECYVDRSSALFGCRPWLWAHDEIGMEIPIDRIGARRASDAAKRLQKVMVESMSHWCPDVPISATVAMCRRWYKGAEPLMRDGMLVPCKPDGKAWVEDDPEH